MGAQLSPDLELLEELAALRRDLAVLTKVVRETSAELRLENRAVRDQSKQAQHRSAELCAAARALTARLREQRALREA